MTTRSADDPAWWESPKVKLLEAIAVAVAIVTSVGGIILSATAYTNQRELERSESARGVFLLPGEKAVILQNVGNLPVFNISLHVDGRSGVMLGALPACSEVDVSAYGELRHIEDRDHDGVGESGVGTTIQFWDTNGRLWHRTGTFGYSTTFNSSLSEPREVDRILPAALPTPAAVVRKIDAC